MSSIVIHAHFYQPPRENPWTGAIDPEPGAYPFHNWNERVYAECYRPNAFARILDWRGRIERIVNNYAHLSFNFGPTLLRWLESAHPRTYAQILAADRNSMERRGGHGNAIAQAYNHAILPLCDERDLRTQIAWGIADFRHRFRRPPESLWLPETACNDETLSALIDAGLAYVILSPFQAMRVRPLGGEWRSADDGDIDPRVAYRYFDRKVPGRSIAIFFYDAAAARAIAFEGALASSQNLVERLISSIGGDGNLVNVATDGETYGHHSRFGDRSLAYALTTEAPMRGLHVTNYGEFLEKHPPASEVEIKPGPEGEGTSWSCGHGLGRWRRDCGCQTGGQPGWNQEWRGPMRAAFDELRDAAARNYEAIAGDLFPDPWATRDAYIELILDRSKNREEFLARQAGRRLSDPEYARASRLLEMQRHAMLMYASCGWFFSDISGIESVQVMKHAGRVLDLFSEVCGPPPENRFLEKLAEAKSNLSEMSNGADIFRRFVPSCRVTPRQIAAHLAISALANHGGEHGSLGEYQYRRQQHRQGEHGRLRLATSRIQLEAANVGERCDLAVAALHLGGLDFYCALQPFADEARFKDSADKLWKSLGTDFLPALLRLTREEFGPDEFGLDDVLPDGRNAVYAIVFGDLLEVFAHQFGHLYDEYHRIAEMLQKAKFELPAEIRQVAEFTLSRRLESEIRNLHGNSDPHAYQKALKIAASAARHGYSLKLPEAAEAFSRMIVEAVADAVAEPGPRRVRKAIDLVNIASRLGLTPQVERAQETLYAAMGAGRSGFGELAAVLGIAEKIEAIGCVSQSRSGDSAEHKPEWPLP